MHLEYIKNNVPTQLAGHFDYPITPLSHASLGSVHTEQVSLRLQLIPLMFATVQCG